MTETALEKTSKGASLKIYALIRRYIERTKYSEEQFILMLRNFGYMGKIEDIKRGDIGADLVIAFLVYSKLPVSFLYNEIKRYP